ncbi:MAG TPA: tetratricopeptide repeat protein [Gemmatimonadota bacterium]|nr:tetratricopeptide repeat protein [Gemmatimonadota bacterium]
MSGRSIGPGLLVLVSFLTLSLGFLVGVRLGRDEEAGGPVAAPHPVGAEEHARLGMQALAAGDMVEAERRFREAVALRPAEPGPRVDLAVALMSQGRWEEADRELAQAKGLAPDLPAIWFLEGWVARDGFGDTLRARRVWERFLELAPPDAPQAAEVRRWLSGEAEDTAGG